MSEYKTFISISIFRTLSLGILLTWGAKQISSQEKLDYNLEKKVGYAINACSYPIRNVSGGKSAAEAVSMADYEKFQTNYQDAKKEKPDILSYSGVVYGKKVNEILPKCLEIIQEYESGKGAADLPLSKNCEHNVMARLKPILPGGAYHSRLSTVWFARKDLESARYRMYLKDGFQSGGSTCAVNDHFKKAFEPLKAKFKEAETQVQKWEAERGVSFHTVENGNTVLFKKDGKVLSSTESNRI